MASAMDSGVDTGNDSNDSSAQEKHTKMDQENSPLSKSSSPSDSGKETTSEEEQDDRNLPHSSSDVEECGQSMSLTHLQPPSLMYGYESPPTHPLFSARGCNDVSLIFEVMNSKQFTGVFVSGGPLGTEFKGKELVTKMSHVLNTFRTMRRRSFERTRDRGWLPVNTLRMCRAACHNNVELMRELLQSGVNPNLCDRFKRTPLHLAACMGYTHIVQMLLDYGADPNAKDSIGNTPLHLAACTNHINVITLLLKAGTRVCEQDLAGHSPLELAITKFNIMKRSIMPHPVLKEQVCQVITMLSEYMKRKEGATIDPDLLNKFESLVRVSDSSEEVETNIRDLLTNLSSLSLSSS